MAVMRKNVRTTDVCCNLLLRQFVCGQVKLSREWLIRREWYGQGKQQGVVQLFNAHGPFPFNSILSPTPVTSGLHSGRDRYQNTALGLDVDCHFAVGWNQLKRQENMYSTRSIWILDCQWSFFGVATRSYRSSSV